MAFRTCLLCGCGNIINAKICWNCGKPLYIVIKR